MTTSIHQRIAEELGVRERQVRAAVELLDDGATVPFIARYRKEVTEMLDDAQLRAIEERLRYLRELEERRTVILESIKAQGKLTPEISPKPCCSPAYGPGEHSSAIDIVFPRAVIDTPFAT